MIWNVKKIKEEKNVMFIGFSKNKSFDGIIEFNKETQDFKLLSIAKDCDEFDSKRLFQFLYTLIQQNMLSFEPYTINIG